MREVYGKGVAEIRQPSKYRDILYLCAESEAEKGGRMGCLMKGKTPGPASILGHLHTAWFANPAPPPHPSSSHSARHPPRVGTWETRNGRQMGGRKKTKDTPPPLHRYLYPPPYQGGNHVPRRVREETRWSAHIQNSRINAIVSETTEYFFLSILKNESFSLGRPRNSPLHETESHSQRKYKDWPREKLSFFYFLSCGNPILPPFSASHSAQRYRIILYLEGCLISATPSVNLAHFLSALPS